MMNKILFACYISIFLFSGIQNSHAGKSREKNELPREEVDVESLSRSMKNLKVKEGYWEPGPPLRRGHMLRIWGEKVRKNPNKYRISNNAVWVWKRSIKSQSEGN